LQVLRRNAKLIRGLVAACLLVAAEEPSTVQASDPDTAVASATTSTPSAPSFSPHNEPFAPDADYDPAVPALETILGFPLGSRPASPEEIKRGVEMLARSSPRVRMAKIGTTHEGRDLLFAMIGAPSTLARLHDLQMALDRVAAGDTAPPEDLPAVVWIGASIHGDEGCGADAALALLYHLAADRSERTGQVLANLLLLVDPLQNPDGRAHFLSEVERWSSRVPGLDSQSLPHRTGWPSARGNHYQIDLNRDWFVLSQPETRAIVQVIQRWHPQVTIDLHEMGSSDTYLMSPPRFPMNPNVPARTREWWKRFSTAQAAAFGARGWSCYTGDWNEEFSPNRGASWTLHTGAVAILEEQAGTDGAAIERPDGSVLSYREAVHHHFVASRAVIESAAAARHELLRDYAANRQEARAARAGVVRAYVIPVDERPGPAHRLAGTLRAQGIEVRRAVVPFALPKASNYWGEQRGERAFPPGSYVIDLRQPEGRLARAVLEFDPPLGSEFLTEERRRLEANESSLLYDASAWCLGMAYGAEVYATESADVRQIPTDPAGDGPTGSGDVIRPESSYGFVVDAGDDGATAALAALLSGGFQVQASEETFRAAGCNFGVGSFLVRRAECGGDAVATLQAIAERTGAHFVGIDDALSDAGPDLGSRRFRTLAPPRIALLAGAPFYESTFGAVWFLVDHELRLPCTLLRLSGLSADTDLDRYNVLIAPDAAPGKGVNMLAALAPDGMLALQDWVRRGGTLLTLGEANWLVFGGTPPFGGLRAQQQVLGELPQYREAAKREIAAQCALVDEETLRRGIVPDGLALAPAPPVAGVSPGMDEWLRRFSPPGSILRADLETRHWLCAGVGRRLPVMVKTDLALRSRQPVETIGRFADAPGIRVSGLLWPEARERWAGSSYLTREKIGQGQVISFLGNPYFRATFLGTGRLLTNAILLGPGMGAKERGGRE
jgi:hypothetical protein